MANPTSLLPTIKGMSRDAAIDELPPGMVWDLADYIPNRRGAKLEGRGPWQYLGNYAFPNAIWGGKHAGFAAGAKLLICTADGSIFTQDTSTGAPVYVGGGYTNGLMNGVMLRDRCYFADGNAVLVPRFVTWNGTAFTVTPLGATAPKARILEVFKDRLIAARDPAQNQRVFFSPLETDGGPPGAWDPLSYVDTSRRVSAFVPMTSQILVFHNKSIEKIVGTIPPGANLDTDMRIDPFSDQMGCEDPASICNYQENVIFANSRGVHMTDGATIRSLTDQGGIGDFWRLVFSRRRAGTAVHAGVFHDYLFISIQTDFTPVGETEDVTFTLVCELSERTWFRFTNFPATCFIEAESGKEELWWGVDAIKRIAITSPTFAGHIPLIEAEMTPALGSDAIDGNMKPVLPMVDLGWRRLGPEGVKRVRHVYVSHQTHPPGLSGPPVNALQVDYRMNVDPVEGSTFTLGGYIPNAQLYTRHRLNIGRRGYGIHLRIKQILPSYLSRLYDISVEQWAQDRGKL